MVLSSKSLSWDSFIEKTLCSKRSIGVSLQNIFKPKRYITSANIPLAMAARVSEETTFLSRLHYFLPTVPHSSGTPSLLHLIHCFGSKYQQDGFVAYCCRWSWTSSWFATPSPFGYSNNGSALIQNPTPDNELSFFSFFRPPELLQQIDVISLFSTHSFSSNAYSEQNVNILIHHRRMLDLS